MGRAKLPKAQKTPRTKYNQIVAQLNTIAGRQYSNRVRLLSESLQAYQDCHDQLAELYKLDSKLERIPAPRLPLPPGVEYIDRQPTPTPSPNFEVPSLDDLLSDQELWKKSEQYYPISINVGPELETTIQNTNTVYTPAMGMTDKGEYYVLPAVAPVQVDEHVGLWKNDDNGTEVFIADEGGNSGYRVTFDLVTGQSERWSCVSSGVLLLFSTDGKCITRFQDEFPPD